MTREEMLLNVNEYIKKHESHASAYDFIFRLLYDNVKPDMCPWSRTYEENTYGIKAMLNSSTDCELSYVNKQVNSILDELKQQGFYDEQTL